jgi:hypothetical protein
MLHFNAAKQVGQQVAGIGYDQRMYAKTHEWVNDIKLYPE